MAEKKATEEMNNVFMGIDNPSFMPNKQNTNNSSSKNVGIIKKEEEFTNPYSCPLFFVISATK